MRSVARRLVGRFPGLRWLNPRYARWELELRRLEARPRYAPGTTRVLGPWLEYVDGRSFAAQLRQIFETEVYRFPAQRPDPYILDCGANVGLSTLYFKRLYPGSIVYAFEPDPHLAAAFRRNVESSGLTGVRLFEAAVWHEAGTLEFHSEGSDAGRLVVCAPGSPATHAVMALRLRDFLDREVDLLKLDVEGAEVDVLGDCAELLGNVHHLFVEYHSFVGWPQRLHELLAIVAAAGFRVHLRPSLASPQPFVQRREHLGMDMLVNIYAFRVANRRA